MRYALLLLSVAVLAGCFGSWSDAATRIAYDLEAAADRLGPSNGDRVTVVARMGSNQFFVRRRREAGAVDEKLVRPHSRRTWILEKGAGETLSIELERQGGRVILAGVR